MQQLTDDFTKANPDIKLNWVTLEENDLRQKVTKDIATKGGQYDVLTIGTYETPIWGKKGWLAPLTAIDKPDDLLPAIRAGLTVNSKLYASPFYGESSFTMYRKDLFEKAGLQMPDKPTWDFIEQAAKKTTDRATGVNGICLRGKAGWGENMAFLDAAANSFGARWFDEKWNPQFDTPEWKKTLTFYLDIMKEAGPQGASGNGFSENLALFQSGKCAMWIDATSAGSHRERPERGADGRRQDRFRAGARRRSRQARQLAVVVGARRSRQHQEGRGRAEVRQLGDQPALSRLCRREAGLGRRAAGNPHLAL